jgi:UDP-N-acetylglucosamine 4,6-dehydratase
MNILYLIDRKKELFTEDIKKHQSELKSIISSSRFLILGGAGSIGHEVTKEIFKRNPKKLHVVDLNENGIVELVRDIRCSAGYIEGDFQTFAIDVGSVEYDAFIEYDGKYDYVLNLAAMKHVRSEKDPYTTMRMIDVNVLNTDKTLNQSIERGAQKYFCASTDKATNPVNMYGASKEIMEMVLFNKSRYINISSARFANVAFSQGSLLYSFNQRIQKCQPIVAPYDVKRYFMTLKECGELCMMSSILSDNRDIFFPKLNKYFRPITFSEIAIRYLEEIGYEPHICGSEEEARELANRLPKKGKWPCLFTKSDTTGEKVLEEFKSDGSIVDSNRFINIGVIKNMANTDPRKTELFIRKINDIKKSCKWSKTDLVNLCEEIIPDFKHTEQDLYLDSKM